jgi:hypothetical protein
MGLAGPGPHAAATSKKDRDALAVKLADVEDRRGYWVERAREDEILQRRETERRRAHMVAELVDPARLPRDRRPFIPWLAALGALFGAASTYSYLSASIGSRNAALRAG